MSFRQDQVVCTECILQKGGLWILLLVASLNIEVHVSRQIQPKIHNATQARNCFVEE